MNIKHRTAFASLFAFFICFACFRLATSQTTTTLDVQIGDTWTALAWRFGLSAQQLRQLNNEINPLLQPAIGDQIIVPEAETKKGRMIRPMPHQSRTLLALTLNKKPSQLGEEMIIPYRPIFLPDPDLIPRDLPIGYSEIELSHVPVTPGQGFAYRAVIMTATMPITVTLTGINGSFLPFDTLREGIHEIGVRGTGAFFPVGTQQLMMQIAEQPLWSQPYLFVAGTWEFQQISYTGAAAQIDDEAIATERGRLFEIWGKSTPTLNWDAEFTVPITNYLSLSSFYGTRRSNDDGVTYRTYHEGVDFAAYGGTPVYATANGTVVVAEPLYVRGGAVIIDHGLGIYSGYYHLSNIIAQAGQTVKVGDLIGEVGTTGLSTGNHLHWDFLVSETWVAGDHWAEQKMGCWLLAGVGCPCQ